MAESTAARLRTLPKGDALTVARIAGIQAAKRTSELVPLCHPLPLTLVEVQLVEFPSEEDLRGYLADGRRQAMAVRRDACVARTEVHRVVAS